MEMKKCTKCQRIKPIAEFAKRNGGEYSTVCKICSADKQREWYEQHRAEISLQRRIKKLQTFARENGFKLEVKYEKHD